MDTCMLGSALAAISTVAAILMPPPDVTVSQWAETYRVLSPEDCASPGRWSNDTRPYQVDIMDAASQPSIQYISVVGPSQWGKALALDTPIPTPGGWTTMGDVHEGDLVYGSDGKIVQVIGESQVQHDRKCFKVTFDDGAEIVADAEHLWFTESNLDGPGIRTTQEILGTLLSDGFHRNHAIPLACISESGFIDLPIPPYTLGAWLGDGDSGHSGITFGEDGREVLENIRRDGVQVKEVDQPIPGRGGRAYLDPLDPGFCLRGHDKKGRATCNICALQRYHARKHGKPMGPIRRNSIRQRLGRLNLLGRKHIPTSYLRASIGQRLALLQGLMDTDGYIRSGGKQCEFTTTNHTLAEGVFELAVSLGFKCHQAEGRALLNKQDCGPKWRITFQAYAETPVFRMKRKLDRQRSASLGRPSKTKRRFITSVEPVSSVPVKCVAVAASDHLYLVGRSMIPTHNTQILNNILGSRIHLNPGPMMVVNATERSSEKWSKTRFTPMVRDCPELAVLIGDPKSRDSSNTILEKTFPGGLLVAVGANAPSGLASQPIRDLFLDEVDRIHLDESAGEEGDYEELAEARTGDFEGRRLIYKCSSPTILGRSRIEKSWNESDQRHWNIACPHCGHEQIPSFRSVVFSESGRPEEAILACTGGGCVITEPELRRAVRIGRWIASRPEVNDHAGFMVHGLMVRSMPTLVKGFLKAKRKSVRSLQVFINTQLGEWWDPREGEALQVEGLLKRARESNYLSGVVPNEVGLLTAAVDVQSENPQRLEILIRGTGAGEQQWTILHEVIPGNLAITKSSDSADSPWDRLEYFLQQQWSRQDGKPMRIKAVTIDIGGHFTKQVYAFCRRPSVKGFAFPVKGATTPQTKLVRKSNTKGRLYLVDTVAAKDQIYASLKIAHPGPSYQNFPQDTDEAYFQQLLAENKVKNKRAYEKKEKDDPNEILDLHVYNDAALAIYAPRDLEALVRKAAGVMPSVPIELPEDPALDPLPPPLGIRNLAEKAPATRQKPTPVPFKGFGHGGMNGLG